jgi:hypothetical protein
MTQFIGIYENAFSKEYCETAIQFFDNMKKNGYIGNRQQLEQINKTLKDDESLFTHSEEVINVQNGANLTVEFNKVFWDIYKKHYTTRFSVLNESGNHSNYSFKIQKTPIGGGYHIWHYESMNRESCHRLLAWMVYLNDVEEGGETEFLYQHMRVKPKQGTLLIWPAAFTHTHRGNPPLSNEKYITTGWTEF